MFIKKVIFPYVWKNNVQIIGGMSVDSARGFWRDVMGFYFPFGTGHAFMLRDIVKKNKDQSTVIFGMHKIVTEKIMKMNDPAKISILSKYVFSLTSGWGVKTSPNRAKKTALVLLGKFIILGKHNIHPKYDTPQLRAEITRMPGGLKFILNQSNVAIGQEAWDYTRTKKRFGVKYIKKLK